MAYGEGLRMFFLCEVLKNRTSYLTNSRDLGGGGIANLNRAFTPKEQCAKLR